MQEALTQYAKIGIAHFMLWPDCVADDDVLVETLPLILDRRDIEIIDYCLPYDPVLRRQLADRVRSSGKDACYVMFPFPLAKISLGSVAKNEQGLIRLVLQNQIEAAVASGAKTIVFASGIDFSGAERPAAKQAFADMCRWFCAQLRRHGMTAALEPFDRTFDRKFLMGPTVECVELVEQLLPEVNNLKLQPDMSHVVLMGESFEHAISTAAPHLARVHLANCVTRDPSDAFYGDRHAPFGYAGGEIDVPQLTQILRLLLDHDFLSPQHRGALILETQIWPGRTAEQTIEGNLQRLHDAWAKV